MLFENNWIQNGDDCITVGNGAKNIHFRYVLSAIGSSNVLEGQSHQQQKRLL